MTTDPNPIHWERYGDAPPRIIDLRTLPENDKVRIIQAALNVSFRYQNGHYEVAENTEDDHALNDLALAVDAIDPHLHEVNLVRQP